MEILYGIKNNYFYTFFFMILEVSTFAFNPFKNHFSGTIIKPSFKLAPSKEKLEFAHITPKLHRVIASIH